MSDSDKSARHNNSSIPVLSFFSGAGLLDLGFISEGFDLVWHNEINDHFVQAHQHGLKSLFDKDRIGYMNHSSVVDLPGRLVVEQAFGACSPPDLFGIIGGPPCPDFSVGGKNRGRTAERGQLSAVYVDQILDLAPTFFLFENVPGLIRTKKHRSFLIELVTKLSDHYVVDVNILNSLDYGVPQDRERIFLVGIHKGCCNQLENIDKHNSQNWARYLTRLKGPEHDKLLHWFPWEEGRRYWNAKENFNWPTSYTSL